METKKKAILAVYIISTMFMLHGMTMALLSYIGTSYGLPNTQVVQISTWPAITGILVAFAVGPLAMRVNKKYLLLVSASCSVAYFAIFSIVGISGGPFGMLLAGALLIGVTQGSGMALSSAIIGEFGEPEKRATYIAISGALMNGGNAVMNLIGGMIAAGNNGANWPYAYLLGFIGIPIAVAFFILMPLKPDQANKVVTEEQKPQEKTKDSLPPRIYLIVCMMLAFHLGFSCFMLNLSFYISDFGLGGPAESGLTMFMFTSVGVCVGFSYPLWARLLKKWVPIFGFTAVTLALFILLRFPVHIAFVYASALIIGIGFNLVNPFIMSTLMSLAPPRLIPLTMSLFMGSINIMIFSSPHILAFVGRFFAPGLYGQFVVGVISMLVCVIAGIFIFIRIPTVKA